MATALPDEITGALAEGAELLTLAAPVRIEADEDGVAKALWVQPQIIGEVDKAGRPRPGTGGIWRRSASRRMSSWWPSDRASRSRASIRPASPSSGAAFVAGLSGQVRDMDSVFAGGDCVTGPCHCHPRHCRRQGGRRQH